MKLLVNYTCTAIAVIQLFSVNFAHYFPTHPDFCDLHMIRAVSIILVYIQIIVVPWLSVMYAGLHYGTCVVVWYENQNNFVR